MVNDPDQLARLLGELLNRLSPKVRVKDKAEGKAVNQPRKNNTNIQSVV